MHQLSGLSAQRGSGVTSVVLFIMILGIAVKLAVAIVPAQLDDRQLTKIIATELKHANDNGDTARELLENTNKSSPLTLITILKPKISLPLLIVKRVSWLSTKNITRPIICLGMSIL